MKRRCGRGEMTKIEIEKEIKGDEDTHKQEEQGKYKYFL
jgi:hypothetical protein